MLHHLIETLESQSLSLTQPCFINYHHHACLIISIFINNQICTILNMLTDLVVR